MAINNRLELDGGGFLRLGDDSGYLILGRRRRVTPLSNYTSAKSAPLNVSEISRLTAATED